MKKIMILAGGTATAWHLVNEIEKYYNNMLEVYICDINPPYLIPSSTKAKKFIQVPPISSNTYYEYIMSILEENKIDIIVPLIDFDLGIFSKDNEDLKKINVKSTAPTKAVVDLLSDKKNMTLWLKQLGIKVPKLYTLDELEVDKNYVLKPKKGFGSMGVFIGNGKDVRSQYNDDFIIQELCENKEVTVEIFKTEKGINTICRERIEVKSGVCTKARIYKDNKLQDIVLKITENIELPNASCIQFMKNRYGEWCITDINLRLGAGTALSSKIGWQLARAAIGEWIGIDMDYSKLFVNFEGDKYVVRVYEEVEMI